MNTLRDQRLKLDLSVDEVARHLAVHPMSVHRWERRERLPGPVHLMALAAKLSLEASTVVDFFDEIRSASDEPPSSIRGQGLREIRRAAAIPVRDMASTVDVLPSTVYNWEAGRVRIPARHLPTLASLLGTDVTVLRSQLERAPLQPAVQDISELRRLRRRTGLSLQHVAERIGTTRRRLSTWERGTRAPLWAVRRLAGVYGLPVARLARAAGVEAPRLLDPARWRPGDLAGVLVAIRAWSGLTQRAVAARNGWHPTTVRSWESGRVRPSKRSREALERLYGLPPGSLLAAYPPATQRLSPGEPHASNVGSRGAHSRHRRLGQQ